MGYTAKDIDVLEGLEPVRRRPGMFIGGVDEDGLHHLAVEVVDNAMDEVLGGTASRIRVELSGNCLTVQDDGRGIPVDAHPALPEMSALEVIMTRLHAGGKFGSGAYETSGGLHGVGISVVNALSRRLQVEVVRENILYTQRYTRGNPKTPLKQSQKNVPFKRGTRICFEPDPKIFGEDVKLNPHSVCMRRCAHARNCLKTSQSTGLVMRKTLCQKKPPCIFQEDCSKLLKSRQKT